MNRKKLLELIGKKMTRKADLVKKGDSSEDAAEIRAVMAEVETLNEEIRSLQDLADNMPDEVTERTVAVTSDVPGVVAASAQPERRAADEDQTEYRTAFRDLVLHGTPIPAELRANANTLTTDIGSAIPTVLVNRIVEKLESIGMILPLVTRTSFAAGVNIPTSSVKPVATWVAEGATSDRQKKTTGVISFSHHKLRCEISMSMESGTMALSAFEASFVRQVSEAMVKAIEEKIVSTDAGTTSNKGILAETPVTGQALDIVALDYKCLIDAEAAIPQAYEGGAVWCMSKKTFMGFIGMVDDQKQPIARVNYGIGGKPERTLLGRSVVLCGDYLPSFSAAADGQIFAFIFNFSDYVLNTIYDMGIQRKQDWDTEDLLTKAVMAVDGKVVDKNSLVTLAKDAG